MLGVPSASGAIPLPKRDPTSVIHRSHRPATNIAVMRLGDLSAYFANAVDIVDQRNMALSDIGGLHRPVIHLKVDVRMIVARPDREIAVVPHPLQVGRQSARTRA